MSGPGRGEGGGMAVGAGGGGGGRAGRGVSKISPPLVASSRTGRGNLQN